jgi:hypothetical protein
VKPDNLPANMIWREAPHRSIPGAIWLANVGYGVVPEPLLRPFRRSSQCSPAATGRECWSSSA